jgi:hypothetical protein
MVGPCPFQKLNLRHDLRLDPDTLFHLLGRQPLSPSSGILLRQIHERTLRDFQQLDPFECLPSR